MSRVSFAGPPGPPPVRCAADRESGPQAVSPVSLSPSAVRRAFLAHPVDRAGSLVDRMVRGGPLATPQGSDHFSHGKSRITPLPSTFDPTGDR
jgi:hypothetical protein